MPHFYCLDSRTKTSAMLELQQGFEKSVQRKKSRECSTTFRKRWFLDPAVLLISFGCVGLFCFLCVQFLHSVVNHLSCENRRGMVHLSDKIENLCSLFSAPPCSLTLPPLTLANSLHPSAPIPGSECRCRYRASLCWQKRMIIFLKTAACKLLLSKWHQGFCAIRTYL